jgi:hypothetical protein
MKQVLKTVHYEMYLSLKLLAVICMTAIYIPVEALVVFHNLHCTFGAPPVERRFMLLTLFRIQGTFNFHATFMPS